MSFYNVVKRRRSVRTFTNKKISESKITKILKCASMAPSALGFQSYKIFVIKNKFMKAGRLSKVVKKTIAY